MSLRKWILVGVVFLMLFAAAFLFIKPTPPPAVKLPNPNGYDDLVKAGQMFVGDLPECYWSKLDDDCLEEVRNYLKANGDALKLIRVGLSRESLVPTEYSQAYISKHMSELAGFKRLAQTLAAEGKVAEKENRIDDAIQSYLDAARLNQKLRGGLLIDSLVGIADETIGIIPLRKLASAMNPEQRRKVIKTLTEFYSSRESLEEIMTRERNYFRYTHGIRDQFLYFAQTIFTRRAAQQKYELKFKYTRTRIGLFLVDLAAQNYQLEKGHPPKTLQELVPEYLPFLPKDDFSGNNFIYRPQTNRYLLYGVGPDGKDQGGKPFINRSTDSGDMLNDSHY